MSRRQRRVTRRSGLPRHLGVDHTRRSTAGSRPARPWPPAESRSTTRRTPARARPGLRRPDADRPRQLIGTATRRVAHGGRTRAHGDRDHRTHRERQEHRRASACSGACAHEDVPSAVIDLDVLHAMLRSDGRDANATWAVARHAAAALAEHLPGGGRGRQSLPGLVQRTGRPFCVRSAPRHGPPNALRGAAVSLPGGAPPAQRDPTRGVSRDPAFLGPTHRRRSGARVETPGDRYRHRHRADDGRSGRGGIIAGPVRQALAEHRNRARRPCNLLMSRWWAILDSNQYPADVNRVL